MEPTPAPATAAGSIASVLQPIPRREQIIVAAARSSTLPMIEAPTFKAGAWRSLARLFTWLSFFASLAAADLWDRLRRRASPDQRGVRLRLLLQKAGGTFVKIGQQLAIRVDLLPAEYCAELSKMLDRMPAFPLEEALATIERTTGRPWHDVFAVFDPEPVGSASIACVYQATLKDGTKVAVKIRRPGIGQVFMADFKVLDWLLRFAEFLSIVRPGFTAGFRHALRETLLEELDFRREAHFQDIFRRNARRKARKRFFTAPRVYFDLSGDEMLVQEFVSGMWIWEIIAAIEQNDPHGLAMMRQLEIDPSTLAKRILWAAFWSTDEHMFFHADPHPANMVVGHGGTVTFVDFGSCGSFNDEQRRAFAQMAAAMRKGDAEGMARGTLKLLEPLPPIDVSSLVKFLEAEMRVVLCTFSVQAQYTEWWERTSIRLWLGMVKAARHYGLSMNMDTLKMLRGSLLYDTVALRLDPTISRPAYYERFIRKDRERWAEKRWRKRMRLMRRDRFLHLEALAEAGEDLVNRAQQTVESPVLNFGSVIEKWVFTFSALSRTMGRLLEITGGAVAALVAVRYFRSETPPDLFDSLLTVLRNRTYQVAVVAVVVLYTRHIVFRLTERDVKPRNSGRSRPNADSE